MTKYKKEQEKRIKNISARVDNTNYKIESVERQYSQVNDSYTTLDKRYDQLLTAHNNLKQDYYLQRAKELGYDKRISFLEDYCRNVFTIDDSPTKYSIIKATNEKVTTLYADGVKVIIPQEEIEFFANIIEALRRASYEFTLPSLSALFDKKETKK